MNSPENAQLQVVCALLREIRDRLSASGGVSSVEIKTSTRGIDVTAKAYAGSSITEAGDAAMEEFLRVAQEMTRRIKDEAGALT